MPGKIENRLPQPEIAQDCSPKPPLHAGLFELAVRSGDREIFAFPWNHQKIEKSHFPALVQTLKLKCSRQNAPRTMQNLLSFPTVTSDFRLLSPFPRYTPKTERGRKFHTSNAPNFEILSKENESEFRKTQGVRSHPSLTGVSQKIGVEIRDHQPIFCRFGGEPPLYMKAIFAHGGQSF